MTTPVTDVHRPVSEDAGEFSGRSSLAAIRCPQVAQAAQRALDAFHNEAGDAVDAEEVRQILLALGTRIAASDGVVPAPFPAGKPALVLARRLLERLREELIEAWRASDPHPTADALLERMAGIEAVRREIDPDWAEYFQSRLLGPDALDLVVEVAHDLRSPLTSILFLAETLQREQSGPVNDVQRRQLGLIYGAAFGLSAVTSDVIELARGGDRLVDQELSPFSVTEILDSVCDIVFPIAEEKGLELKIRPPESDERLGHPLALSRVLLNLTTNALKFTDEGAVAIAAVPSGPGRIEFSVTDTGRGIPPAALESLYQPFRRTAARRGYCFSGTGLGLAICRKLVEAMGAELQVVTSADSGTRFIFDLRLPPAGTL